MNVVVLSNTSNPVLVISKAAGVCYGKRDYSKRRVETCYRNGHMSPFEHVSVTLKIGGISRACSHQLVRHRLASYNQQSQRYCRIDVDNNDWYVTPPDFEGKQPHEFADHMRACAESYLAALRVGVRPEDARYALPEATKTEIVVSMNARELFHFLDTRLDHAAQWEIRALAEKIVGEVKRLGTGWNWLMHLREGEGGER